ncbi:MAG: exonuclease domain-containing protein [Defluviitaleaceae bacterium]|nr:exonuclease domain-containing protein [Defluviitaleaceae bacterium]
MSYYVLDLEYNQYFDFRDNRRPEPACPAEIIQMGLVVMDDKFKVLDRRETLVRPQIYRRLHPYVARITGINNKDLQSAPVFPDAFKSFFGIAFGKKAAICTWGRDDIKELYRNILFYDLNHKKLTRQYIDVQRVYGEYHRNTNPITPEVDPETGETITPPIQQTALKTAVNRLGLAEERRYHMALADAEYTAEILRHMLSDPQNTCDITRAELNLELLENQTLSRKNSINVRLLQQHGEHLLGKKLTEKEKTALIEMYMFGRLGKFDVTSRRGKRRLAGELK